MCPLHLQAFSRKKYNILQTKTKTETKTETKTMTTTKTKTKINLNCQNLAAMVNREVD